MKKSKETRSLRFLYNTAIGRFFLKILTARWISKLAGKFLDSRASKPLIKKFVRKNNINLSEYYADNFTCFNDCFTRKIRDGLRPVDALPTSLISPCDSLLSAYHIDENLVLKIKGSEYRIEDLLNNAMLAESFRGGVALVFRLCVTHYHRYIYFDNGNKGDNVFIPGKLHTVRPIALEALPVFVRNCREYTIMKTDNFGTAAQIEVGALLVGKIKNHHSEYTFTRGEEKGMFLYGGSTIVLLLEKNRANLREDIFLTTENGLETDVMMGEKIGEAIIK
ncbi:MAG: phosphatidylserine decarboxylase [Ruminococcaceae bacterium]|nr:phosphatidylserine decarboxylase [Oscillospiraceae bacterium]